MDLLKDVWLEKYRPKNLDELCITDKLREDISNFGEDIPHLLFVGTPGTGKTTLAKIIVQDILKCDYIYINASDENGIETVRSKISGFAQTKSLDGRLKVIVLDESDFFSASGAAALRNTMEEYSKSTRFILTANYKHKIIPAIQSRCKAFSVVSTIKSALTRCLYILKQENIRVDNDQKKLLASLVKSTFPDMRTCINEIYANSRKGYLDLGEKVNNAEFCEIVFEGILKGESLKTRKYLIENDEKFGSDWEKLLVDLLNHVYNSTLEDSKKKAMIMIIAEHLDKCTRVNDREINFFACMLNLED